MSLKSFQGPQFNATDLQTVVRQANDLVGAIKQFVTALIKNSGLDSVRVQSAVLTGGVDTVVNHKLDRQPQEWWITDINAAATVYRVAWSKTTIILRASATVTADLRVA